MIAASENTGPSPQSRGASPRRVARPIMGLAIVAVVGAWAVSLAGFVAWRWPGAWVLDLLNHFRPQVAVVTAAAALLVGIGRRWRWLVAAVVILGVNLALLAPLFFGGGGRPPVGDAEVLRILHFNVLSSNDAYAEVVDYLAASEAELILVQEVSETWSEHLARVPGYRAHALLPRRDNFGLAVLAASGRELSSISEVDLGVGVPALEIDIKLDGVPLSILSVHTLPPASAEYARRRDQMLASAALWAGRVRRERALAVIVGDLNATPFSGAFRSLVADGDLVDSELGFGLQTTWPTEPWLMRALFSIPIDHLLHDAGLVTVDRSVGPELGSDHRPLRVDLALARGTR